MLVSWQRIAFALVTSTLLAGRGYAKKSLSIDGAITAFFTGLIHCFAGYDFTAVLAVFFLSSSALTKYKSDVKHKIEAEWKEGGQRDTWQVLANSSTASILCVLYLAFVGLEQYHIDFNQRKISSYLICAFIAHYACCNGDTWASELGVLSTSSPILITTLKRVPKGTNGGISVLGTVASVTAGFVIGLTYYLLALAFAIPDATTTRQWPIILIATISGALGSIIDSLLGATLQYSAVDLKSGKVVSHPGSSQKHITGLNILNNHTVNYVSSVLTSVLIALVSPSFF